MPRGRISKKSVDALVCTPGKDREILWDDALAGFGVVSFPTGKKVYVAQYRQHGRSRRFAIGEHGRLTPDEARSLAKVHLGQVAKGLDPLEERKAERAKETFRETAARFMAVHVSAKRKRRTKEEYQRLLDIHILPNIGARRMVDLSRSEIAHLHEKLSASPCAANRSLALISSIWNWAAKRDEVAFEKNPAKGIERNKEGKRERFLTSDEFARLGDALRQAETDGIPWAVDEENPKSKHTPKSNPRTTFDPFAVAAIRLLILTGARLREILNMKWEQVDFERGIIHLADSKTGAKPIYLSAAALQILNSLPRIDGNPYVIAGKDDAPRADLHRPWAAVRRAAGLPGVRIHDLRHSFASFGAGASLGLPIIGKLLGHSQAATTARYAHLDADPMRRAAETIGSTIAAAMNRRPSAEVTPLQAARGRNARP